MQNQHCNDGTMMLMTTPASEAAYVCSEPGLVSPNSASSPPHILLLLLLLLLLHIFSSSSSLWDRILLRRTAPTTRRDTQLDVERRSLLLSRLLSLLSAQSAHSSRCSCRLLIDQTLSASRDLLHVAGRVSSGRQQHGQTSCQDGPRPACQPVCVLAVLAAY